MGIDLPLIWAGIIVFGLMMYVVMDGFDLGLAMLFPFARDDDRDTMVNTIAPVWDGNETWLVLGGGAVLSTVTRERLRGHRVVHLTIGVAEGVRRSQGPGRPLLSGGDVTARYQALLTERAALYREVAWTTVSTERRSSGKVVSDIVDRLDSGDPHPRGAGGRTR